MSAFWFAFSVALTFLCALASAALMAYLLVMMARSAYRRRRRNRAFISDLERRRYDITAQFDLKTRTPNGRR